MNNAQEILKKVEKLIKKGGTYKIELIYDELSIFDWFTENLTQTHLKQMKSFLKLAIDLDYTGYVCFKVGASGYANGMWAHKEESTTGFAPKGNCIYRSFTPDYTYYSFKIKNEWYPNDDLKTQKQLKEILNERN